MTRLIKPWKSPDYSQTNEFFDLDELKKHLERYPSEDLLWEPKIDGLRCRVVCNDGDVRLFSFWGNEFLADESLKRDIRLSVLSDCVLDGELYSEHGDCDYVYSVVKEKERLWPTLKVAVFDVLEVDGEDLCARTLKERKRVLDSLVRDTERFSVLKSSVFAPQEGYVVKHLDSDYSEEGSKRWWKFVSPDYLYEKIAYYDFENLSEEESRKARVILNRFKRKLREGKNVPGWNESDIDQLLSKISIHQKQAEGVRPETHLLPSTQWQSPYDPYYDPRMDRPIIYERVFDSRDEVERERKRLERERNFKHMWVTRLRDGRYVLRISRFYDRVLEKVSRMTKRNHFYDASLRKVRSWIENVPDVPGGRAPSTEPYSLQYPINFDHSPYETDVKWDFIYSNPWAESTYPKLRVFKDYEEARDAQEKIRKESPWVKTRLVRTPTGYKLISS